MPMGGALDSFILDHQKLSVEMSSEELASWAGALFGRLKFVLKLSKLNLHDQLLLVTGKRPNSSSADRIESISLRTIFPIF